MPILSFGNFSGPYATWRPALVILSVVLVIGGLLLGVNAVSQVMAAHHEESLNAQLPAAVTATANPPVQINIPALSINAPVVELGLNANGSLQTPNVASQVGWYAAGTAPGQNGAAIMVGHLDTAFGPAIFWHLKNLQSGDPISITLSNGSAVNFVVDHVTSYNFNNIPTQAVYGATSSPTLRLITCSGSYSSVDHHYSENLVVYANLQK